MGKRCYRIVTITRGCDNMYFLRSSFLPEVEKEVVIRILLLKNAKLWLKIITKKLRFGQNVDSYLWYGGGPKKILIKLRNAKSNCAVNFRQLLEMVAKAVPGMRIRFSTSNPHEMTEEVFRVIAKYDNVCKYIHLPVQSGK